MADMKGARETLTLVEAGGHVSYCHETGHFTWLVNTRRKPKGARAGSERGGSYRTLTINGTQYAEHRLAWLFISGEWPKNQIDHINGIRDDNRASNLREATLAENARNRKRYATNTTGYKGVSWDRGMKKYRAQIQHKRRTTVIGHFARPEDAHAAYVAAAREIHGEFANTGVRQ